MVLCWDCSELHHGHVLSLLDFKREIINKMTQSLIQSERSKAGAYLLFVKGAVLRLIDGQLIPLQLRKLPVCVLCVFVVNQGPHTRLLQKKDISFWIFLSISFIFPFRFSFQSQTTQQSSKSKITSSSPWYSIPWKSTLYRKIPGTHAHSERNLYSVVILFNYSGLIRVLNAFSMVRLLCFVFSPQNPQGSNHH